MLKKKGGWGQDLVEPGYLKAALPVEEEHDILAAPWTEEEGQPVDLAAAAAGVRPSIESRLTEGHKSPA